MDTPREIELKLECDGPDLTVLAGHPLLQVADAAGPEHLEAVYFDTPDRALRAAGLSLRVRREGGRAIQALKAASVAAGLFDRPEWEWEVSGSEPDPALLAGTPAGTIVGADGGGLEPQFRTIVERTTRPVRYGAAEISVTLDAGRVETPAGDVPLCEIELELKEGTAADLFALAQALGETVPLRLGAMSKGERGFALIEKTLRKPRKAEALTFEKDITAGEAFVRIAQGCLRHLRHNEDVFLHKPKAEALHQMRVALRRLRSAFTLYKPVLQGDATAETLREEIRRVTEPFGRARNLDVFLSETLAAEIERRPDEAGLQALRARIEADRARAYDVVLATLASRAWRSLLIDLVTWIEAGPWRVGGGEEAGDGATDGATQRDRPADAFAAEVLERLRRRIARRGRQLAKLSPEKRHRLRIAAKKLRYGAEFFGPLFTGKKKGRRRQDAFVSALSDLQDHLGALNDLATAHEIADQLIAERGRDEGGTEEPATGSALFAAGLTAADNEARADALIARAEGAQADLLDVKRFWRR